MRNIKQNSGLILIMLLVFISIVLWFLAPGTGFDFTNFAGWAAPLSQLLGIVGFTLFALNIILSARFHFLENLFYGLNRVYEKHALIGKTAFYLLLIHPLLIFIMYANFAGWTFTNFFEFFTPRPDKGALNWGILSLGLLILLVALTIWFRPKYHIWKWTHRFMGVALFLGGAHAFLMPSTIASYDPLRYYMIFIFSISVLVYIYHSILGRFLIKKYKYAVSSVKVLGGNITEVVLSPKGRQMRFTPGQFAFVSFHDSKVSSESHPFSLSSYAEGSDISFTMKNLGDFTSTLPALKVGARALIEGPFGKFSYEEAKSKNQIWVAGGIGVTPYLSMIRSVRKETDAYKVDLYYCLKNESEAVHYGDLKSLETKNIRVIPHYSDTQDFINAEIIQKNSGGLEGKSIFLCAPPLMIGVLRKGFKKLGVEEEYLHSEEFKL